MKKVNNLNLVLVNILSLILGIILFVATENILTVFNYIFVCIFAVLGVIQIISFILEKSYLEDDYNSLILGIVFIWLALIMYVYYMIIINILPIIFSLYLFIIGVLMVVKYFNNIRKNNIRSYRYLILGLISIIVGILLIFEPIFSIFVYLKITGINIILVSVMSFLELISNRVKRNG